MATTDCNCDWLAYDVQHPDHVVRIVAAKTQGCRADDIEIQRTGGAVLARRKGQGDGD